MLGLGRNGRDRKIGDRELAGLLASEALMELRVLARRMRISPEGVSLPEAVKRLDAWADFSRDMVNVALGDSAWRPRPGSRRERAMWERPLSYQWNTWGPDRRAWVLRQVEQAGLRWTPPPPLPTPRKGVPAVPLRRSLGALARWPVRTPPGRQPLPRQARVLKALDREALFALYQEAGRLRLGLGKASPRLYAHLDPQGPHFIVPDPADYYWPDPKAGRCWWECRVLVRMADGEQVSSTLAVVPETFTALASTVPALRQRRLAYAARFVERDVYLWGRDHEPHCSPEQCGYATEGP